jgi:hypothetical protein
MSLAEIEREIGKLSAEEQDILASYLAVLKRARTPEFRRELGDAMRRMDGGNRIEEENVIAEHQRLISEGR